MMLLIPKLIDMAHDMLYLTSILITSYYKVREEQSAVALP
jgi:hypothetical protein